MEERQRKTCCLSSTGNSNGKQAALETTGLAGQGELMNPSTLALATPRTKTSKPRPVVARGRSWLSASRCFAVRISVD